MTGTGSSASSLRTIHATRQNQANGSSSILPGLDTSLFQQYYGSDQLQYSPTFPPVPPARTSSLHPSGVSSQQPPSLQVIQPTPTKVRKSRRKSGFSSISSQGSPTHGAFDMDMELGAGPSRTRGRDEMEEDVSEEQRLLEEKKARTREKGRERQRRKRERDKVAKEEAQAKGQLQPQARTALTTATHLPIPARTTSTGQPALPLAISVPSSTSSSYSQLPSYYGMSPNPSYTPSLSGQSSPGLLFSPAISALSTSGMETATSGTSLDVPAPVKKSRGRPRGHSATSRPMPLAAPTFTPVKFGGPSPAKRRKSEPEPEEFRIPKKELGLGVMINEATWETEMAMDRPKPRRTASDGATLPGIHRASSRSPTPPPVPMVSSQYLTPILAPTDAGNSFASTLILGLTTSGLMPGLEQALGLSQSDLEELRPELAAVYERWCVAKGMRNVSLGSGAASEMDSMPSSAGMSSAPMSVTTESNPTSPLRQNMDFASSSYVTPAPARIRQPLQYANTMPGFIPTADSPTAHTNVHSRNRSLSSTSMLARGLVINPISIPANQYTEVLQHAGSEGTTTSPGMSSLQTPSTGQGAFPMVEIPQDTSHWRSATDPTHGRSYIVHAPRDDQAWTSGPLESPIAVTAGQNKSMPPPHQHPHMATQQYYNSAYSTPSHRIRAAAVPFTPETPLQRSNQSQPGAEYCSPMLYAPQQMAGPVDPNQGVFGYDYSQPYTHQYSEQQ